MKHRIVAALLLAGIAAPAVVQAHDLSVTECHEGRDFIRNAALSRDQGLSRDEFIGRMQEDLELIKAFPPDLRWFVQDSEDETLLVGAARGVFDRPVDPEQHGDEFLTSCIAVADRVTVRE
ncbi:MAG: hypothetical protein JNL33_07050 [Betaproteobacteria bacterium]|nr:hypothetical protein [Betaproteobacteria bacterium]